MTTQIDYTTLRKGTVVFRRKDGRVIERIEICPKCGRKGAVRAAFVDRASKKTAHAGHAPGAYRARMPDGPR